MFGKLRILLGLVFSRAPDTSTLAGRSRDRYRRIAHAAVARVAARCVTIITALIVVPLTLQYLGAERYGLWMTITSFIAILAFADLGLGNGLLNAISEANGKDDRRLAQEAVSSACVMLVGVAVLLAVVFAGSYAWIPWKNVFNVTSDAAATEAGPGIAAMIACFLLSIPFGIVQRVQAGYQEGFVNSLWLVAGRLLGLGLVLLVVFAKGGLPWLVLAFSGGPVIALLLNSIVLFGWRRRWLLPRWTSVTMPAARKIMQRGVMFFLLQVAGAVAFASDNIVVAHVLGAEAVAQYSVPQRLFTFPMMIVGFMLSPLWPAYGEAVARHDVGWVRRTLKRSIVLSVVLSSVLAVLLVVFGSPIIRAWVGPQIRLSPWLLLGLGVWSAIGTVGMAMAMFMNGVGLLRPQVICAVIMCIASIGLKILFGHHWGLAGVVWGVVIAYVTCALVPLSIILPRQLRRLDAEADQNCKRRARRGINWASQKENIWNLQR